MLFDVRLAHRLLLLLQRSASWSRHSVARAPTTLSAGINIDLVWGSVMAVFGAVMLGLAALAKRGRLGPAARGLIRRPSGLPVGGLVDHVDQLPGVEGVVRRRRGCCSPGAIHGRTP